MLLLLLQAAAPPRLASAPKVVRAEMGPSGAVRGGTFVLDEQREAFDVSKDKQLYAVFEWEGTAGPHHCELSWIAPDGTTAMQASLTPTMACCRL